jgi:hypothetical protein
MKLHSKQTQVFAEVFIRKQSSYYAVACSRGWGKSFLAASAAIKAIFELLDMPSKTLNKNVYIIAPTHSDVVEIYYPLLMYEMQMEYYVTSSSADRGILRFEGGVELRLLSYESIERMRGKGAYFVIWDEVSSCNKGLRPIKAWEGVIQPALVTRWPGVARCLMISTTAGFNFFAECLELGWDNSHQDWMAFSFDYTTSPYISADEIEKLKHQLDPVVFASEYLVQIKESGNSIFYCFDRKIHIRKDLEDFQPGEVVYVNIDFNVAIQASTAWALRGGQVHILEEFKGAPNTEVLAQMLVSHYAGHKIVAHPDPSGRSRKTSAAVGKTDFTILENAGITCLAPRAAPSIVDSAKSVNAMLMTAAGETNLYIHPRCVGAIKSLERTKWTPGNGDTATVDKSESIEHFSDGIRYGIHYHFPIQSTTPRHSPGRHF